MKQILQSLKDGTTEVANVPAPGVKRGYVLVNATASLVSAGTERMLVEFGKGNWVSKARQQPDKVREVVEKVRTDGLATTWEAVQSKLDQPLPLGYSNVGRVSAVGDGLESLSEGDRVVSNGPHAEVVSVPRHLCARIPDSVSDEWATFTVVGAIGLQGIRLAQPTLGERFVVTGLGLIGLLVVQLLRAQGCRVLGIDFDPDRLALARHFGAETVNPGEGEDVLAAARAFSGGDGVDGVLITASTKSNEPVSQAAQMCRKRGRIVLIGVTGLELNRADFYEKELSFQVSCSYGPGRYDAEYEDKGHDYPIGFVRWTEQRNFEAVLDLMASGALNLDPLITHRYEVSEAAAAFELLARDSSTLGILLQYPGQGEQRRERQVRIGPEERAQPLSSDGSVAFLGAGNHATRVLVPAFRVANAGMSVIVSAGGVSARHAGRKHGFHEVTTDEASVYGRDDIDTVVVATRHDLHARQVLQALKSGKHVYCEKPLCLTLEDQERIETEVARRPGQHLMAGFNRRFSPLMQKMQSLLSGLSEPCSIMITVNAGDIPADHWTQDPDTGGGRIIGEACHFIDLARHIAGSPIESYAGMKLGPHPALAVSDDKSSITLKFANGSFATINYLANGHKGFPKERIEVFAAGRILQLDNFRKLRGWGWPEFSSQSLWRQDKGVNGAVEAFLRAIRNQEETPIPVSETLESNRVSIELAEALRTG